MEDLAKEGQAELDRLHPEDHHHQALPADRIDAATSAELIVRGHAHLLRRPSRGRGPGAGALAVRRSTRPSAASSIYFGRTSTPCVSSSARKAAVFAVPVPPPLSRLIAILTGSIVGMIGGIPATGSLAPRTCPSSVYRRAVDEPSCCPADFSASFFPQSPLISRAPPDHPETHGPMTQQPARRRITAPARWRSSHRAGYSLRRGGGQAALRADYRFRARAAAHAGRDDNREAHPARSW